MRGQQKAQVPLFSYISTQDQIPATQPLRQVRLPKPWIGSTPTSVGFTRRVVAPRSHQKMLGTDKSYDNRDLVADLRISGIAPLVALKIQARCNSPIDDRTARHQSYSQSINTKKRIEQCLAGSSRPPASGSSRPEVAPSWFATLRQDGNR